MKNILFLMILILELFSKELISAIPLYNDYNMEQALLGKKLFHDTRLSRDNTISCASCHIINEGGDDNRDFSLGVENKVGTVNSPTILNVRYNFVQFWDGRARDLSAQASGPIHNPVEMDTNFNQLIEKLKKDKSYIKAFKIYFDGITEKNIIHAIVEFEKALTTPNSRFDRYLLGEREILSKEELEGYKYFKDFGCISCHNGVNIGGNLYQKMGVIKEYEAKSESLGRFDVTQKEEDKYYFKVPSLRNIELTKPYLHDGKAKELRDVIKIMIEHQVGIYPQQKEIDKILLFLKTLTGETPSIMEQK